MTERLTRHDADGLCTLTLNRPEKLNALDSQIFHELCAHLDALENQTGQIGCVILRGAGRGFCAGMDLSVVGREVEPAQFKPDIINRLARLPQPLIGAVHGACYTGGLELLLACDIIAADTTARFCDTHGKWGLVPTWGLCQRLPRRVGTAAAKRMMMSASVITGEEAKNIGLVDILAPEGQLEIQLNDLARNILSNSWHVNSALKTIIHDTDGMSLDCALAYERNAHPGHAPDHRDRIDRFSRKSGSPR